LTPSTTESINNQPGIKMMARKINTMMVDESLGFPPNRFDNELCSGENAIARMIPQSNILTNGSKSMMHHATINARNKSRMEVS